MKTDTINILKMRIKFSIVFLTYCLLVSSCGPNNNRQKNILPDRDEHYSKQGVKDTGIIPIEDTLKGLKKSFINGAKLDTNHLTEALGSKNIDTTNIVNTTLKPKLPFIGERNFEMTPAFSGTGTVHRSITIKNNGDVFFSFEQDNQSDGGVTTGKYYAGKYTKYMVCIFKILKDTTYYEIQQDTIYVVDKNGERIKSDDCCLDYMEGKRCPCESAYLKIE